MPETEDNLAKLRRRLAIAHLILLTTLVVGAGATLVTLYFAASPSMAVPGVAENTMMTSETTTASRTQTALSTSSEQRFIVTASVPEPLAIAYVRPETYGYVALLSWIAFFGALIWRGHIRSVWSRSRFSYDTFRLLVRMRGAQTRLKLMHSLNEPRNKLQLATALGIDWKAVDKHVQVLEEKGLIKATMTSGTSTFYEVTDKGRRALEVLEELGALENRE
jgi:DNA-binding MarR family transcriptional regulator